MNKTNLLSTGLLALTIGVMGFGAGIATQAADASHNGNEEFKGEGDKPEIIENIDREIENLDDGVQITITSEDSEAVEKIQERHTNGDENKGPQNDDVEFDVELIDDGVLVTITSDDDETVERIQEHAENPQEGKGNHGEKHCEREDDDEA
ncbi:MAG: TusA-related sulfurtransferase [Oceanicoccus sp.]|jgi:TusA-related sulfurtransferase